MAVNYSQTRPHEWSSMIIIVYKKANFINTPQHSPFLCALVLTNWLTHQSHTFLSPIFTPSPISSVQTTLVADRPGCHVRPQSPVSSAITSAPSVTRTCERCLHLHRDNAPFHSVPTPSVGPGNNILLSWNSTSPTLILWCCPINIRK